MIQNNDKNVNIFVFLQGYFAINDFAIKLKRIIFDSIFHEDPDVLHATETIE